MSLEEKEQEKPPKKSKKLIIKENEEESLQTRQLLITNRLEKIKDFELSPLSPKNYSFLRLKSLSSSPLASPISNRFSTLKGNFLLSPISMNQSNSLKTTFKFHPASKPTSKHKKLSKINYFYNKKMPNWAESNPIKQKIDKEIYKFPLSFKNTIIRIKKQKKKVKLEKYHRNLIEAANIGFSKEAVDQLSSTFTSLRKANASSSEKCILFLRKIEKKEKAIVKDFVKQKTMFNKIFYELSDRKKENLLKPNVQFSSVFNSKKYSK